MSSPSPRHAANVWSGTALAVTRLRRVRLPADERATAGRVWPLVPTAAGVVAAAHVAAALDGARQLRAAVAADGHGTPVDDLPNAALCSLLSNIASFACRVAGFVSDGSRNKCAPFWVGCFGLAGVVRSSTPVGPQVSAVGGVRLGRWESVSLWSTPRGEASGRRSSSR